MSGSFRFLGVLLQGRVFATRIFAISIVFYISGPAPLVRRFFLSKSISLSSCPSGRLEPKLQVFTVTDSG